MVALILVNALAEGGPSYAKAWFAIGTIITVGLILMCPVYFALTLEKFIALQSDTMSFCVKTDATGCCTKHTYNPTNRSTLWKRQEHMLGCHLIVSSTGVILILVCLMPFMQDVEERLSRIRQENQNELAESSGLSPNSRKLLPDSAFRKIVKVVQEKELANLAAIRCSICLETLSVRAVGELNCGHCFHVDCIRKWLEIAHRPSCPYCRRSFKTAISSA